MVGLVGCAEPRLVEFTPELVAETSWGAVRVGDRVAGVNVVAREGRADESTQFDTVELNIVAEGRTGDDGRVSLRLPGMGWYTFEASVEDFFGCEWRVTALVELDHWRTKAKLPMTPYCE